MNIVRPITRFSEAQFSDLLNLRLQSRLLNLTCSSLSTKTYLSQMETTVVTGVLQDLSGCGSVTEQTYKVPPRNRNIVRDERRDARGKQDARLSSRTRPRA